MSSPRLEAFLARLYTDEALLAAFLADAATALAGSGLTPAEEEAVAAIDRNGLAVAARSYRAKRARRRKSGWLAWLLRIRR
jgi:hypothetical protein